MQTQLMDAIKDTPEGQEAEAILRKCVHCGMCNATCPTYQLLGDELDGPRGRIYLIKQALEGKRATRKTQLHLDRCLTCLSCETTCPSGVQFGRLLDIGRKLVDQQVYRPITQRLLREGLRQGLTRPVAFNAALKLGRFMRPVLPQTLQERVPLVQRYGEWPQTTHTRTMLLLDGCVQPSLSPNINVAAARVLDVLGVQLIVAPNAGCCGAIHQHLDAQETALHEMRRNIDAWWPFVEQGAEALVMTASGCGMMVKEYGRLLAHDNHYADKAQRIAAMARDISEVLVDFADVLALKFQQPTPALLAWHAPCSLQHGQQIHGKVEQLLSQLGIKVSACADSHLCCGSAGTYSLLQTELSKQLRDNKLRNLEAGQPALILSANIGCISHLQSGTATPVMHWVELLAQGLL